MKAGHLRPWQLLPAPPGTCPECAIEHDPSDPHNAQSMHYQYWFFNQHGRWPRWGDALAHCSENVKSYWSEELRKAGQEL